MKRLILLLIVAALPLVLFFVGYEIKARILVRDAALPPHYANAFKHSGAAKDVYRALVVLSIEDAEERVIRLGLLNERVEQYAKSYSPDSTLEMAKDMQNNLVGIAAAAWQLKHQNETCTDPLLVVLAKGGVLAVSGETLAMLADEKARFSETHDVNTAYNWFNAQRARIVQQVNQKLDTCNQSAVAAL